MCYFPYSMLDLKCGLYVGAGSLLYIKRPVLHLLIIFIVKVVV